MNYVETIGEGHVQDYAIICLEDFQHLHTTMEMHN